MGGVLLSYAFKSCQNVLVIEAKPVVILQQSVVVYIMGVLDHTSG